MAMGGDEQWAGKESRSSSGKLLCAHALGKGEEGPGEVSEMGGAARCRA